MRHKKLTFFLIVLILAVGMWMGINIGRDRPLFSNPFAKKSKLQKEVERSVKKGTKDVERSVKKGTKNAKKALRDALKDD